MLEYSMFERLPYRSQREALKKEGTLIARRQVNGYTILLYTLGHTFVEVWTGAEAEVVSTFKQTASAMAVLEPYADEIDIRQLISTLS
ncbi:MULTISPECIES: hypothetical protein [Pontibacter]|uniref:Uncharacterized protein n=1 Tax=Pontibacter lucknowensis TaxID=1077936 RepID=A0A1N7APZ9_9BACT|nr:MULTISPECIES: hypothetical protein [Pontibacter]EJF08141.1 hypothetical protein O71_22621 [Pontibacter sp. BAB1700]SIR41237.1 hypothetical protein SAMN05421545_3492 [Pontibacter lucknowensis]